MEPTLQYKITEATKQQSYSQISPKSVFKLLCVKYYPWCISQIEYIRISSTQTKEESISSNPPKARLMPSSCHKGSSCPSWGMDWSCTCRHTQGALLPEPQLCSQGPGGLRPRTSRDPGEHYPKPWIRPWVASSLHHSAPALKAALQDWAAQVEGRTAGNLVVLGW